MEYSVNNNDILLPIPAGNDGKYRFKKRANRLEFGETFPTRKDIFDGSVYLEWQIGYDVPVKDIKEGKAKTQLTQKAFKDGKGDLKYPSELSEIFYTTIKMRLISKKEVEDLLEEIKSYSDFIDEREITVGKPSELILNRIKFEETSIKLPTFFMTETPDETQIEVSIQKQQYATGIQPMIYFCIPFTSFSNSSDLSGRPSTPKDKLIYVINKSNVQNIISLLKVFGMSSKRHNYDIVQIIGTLLEIISNE